LARGRGAGRYGDVFEPTLSTLEVPSWPCLSSEKAVPLIRRATSACERSTKVQSTDPVALSLSCSK
jgi:hypothetical protein